MHTTEKETESEQQQQQITVGTRVYAWGSAETDQFPMPNPDRFETRRPVLIDDFVKMQIYIRSISCGSQHTVFLSTQGDVYTMGSGDEGQLGREATEGSPVNRPAKVNLPQLCDMITAGEAHSTAANSLNGIIYTWGVFRNTQGNMIAPMRVPVRTGLKDFQGTKFQKVLSGNNHVMVLTTEKKLYMWGDNETYVLGRPPKLSLTRGNQSKTTETLPIEVVTLRSIKDVFTAGYHCFAVTHKKVRGEVGHHEAVFGWGKNNWGQLGIGNEESTFTPTELTALAGKQLKAITGGEDHTLFLLEDGSLYGCGRNDDFQLGPIDNQEIPYTDEEKAEIASRQPTEGTDQPAIIENRRYDTVNLPIKIQIEHPVARIFANNHYSIVASASNSFFSWGCGMSYVLGNGKDDEEVRDPHPISESFFTGAPISHLTLGSNHVIYTGATSFFEELPLEFNQQRIKQPRLKQFAKVETDSGHSLLERKIESRMKDIKGQKLAARAEKEAAELAAKALENPDGIKSPSNRSNTPKQPELQEKPKQPKSESRLQKKGLKNRSKADKSTGKGKRTKSSTSNSKSKSTNKRAGSAKKTLKEELKSTKSSHSVSKKQGRKPKPKASNGHSGVKTQQTSEPVHAAATSSN
jgi:regulator of chromosome condensation